MHFSIGWLGGTWSCPEFFVTAAAVLLYILIPVSSKKKNRKQAIQNTGIKKKKGILIVRVMFVVQSVNIMFSYLWLEEACW